MTTPDDQKVIPLKRCKPTTYCKFCKAEGEAVGEVRKVRCTVMTKHKPPYHLRDWYKHYSCDDHIHMIEDPDPHGVYDRVTTKQGDTAPGGRSMRCDDHYTEADYQTWMRL